MNLTGPIIEKGIDMFLKKKPMKHGYPLPRMWILIADHTIAKVFNKTTGENLTFVGEATPSDNFDVIQSNVDLQYIAGSNPCSGKSAIESQPLSFLYDLNDWLDDMETNGAFDRLVIIAPAEVLSDLRTIMGKSLQTRIIAEVDKDFTKFSNFRLIEAMKKVVWF